MYVQKLTFPKKNITSKIFEIQKNYLPVKIENLPVNYWIVNWIIYRLWHPYSGVVNCADCDDFLNVCKCLSVLVFVFNWSIGVLSLFLRKNFINNYKNWRMNQCLHQNLLSLWNWFDLDFLYLYIWINCIIIIIR